MTNKQHQLPVSMLLLSQELIDCLHTKTNHRLSRFDAFIWLIGKIHSGGYSSFIVKDDARQKKYICSYSRLASEWNWCRQSVKEFIDELRLTSYIKVEKIGNNYAFSFDPTAGNKIIL